MLFPERVEHLQEHLLLELAHGLGARQFLFGVVGRDNLFQNTLTQILFVELAVLVQPFLNRQIDGHLRLQLALQAGNIPLLRHALRRDELTDQRVHHILANGFNHLGNVFRGHDLVTLIIDHRTLVVGNIIVFQQGFPHIEVAAFHLALGFFNGVGDHSMLDGLAFFHPHGLHQALHPIRREYPHQVIFQRQEEP